MGGSSPPDLFVSVSHSSGLATFRMANRVQSHSSQAWLGGFNPPTLP